MPNSMMIIIMNQQGENTEFILFDTTGTSTGIITRLHPQGKGGPKGVRRWRLALVGTDTGSRNLVRFRREVHRSIAKIISYSLNQSNPMTTLSIKNYLTILVGRFC